MSSKVGVVRVGAGNVRSLGNALQTVGASTISVRVGADVAACSHLVIPGVGAFRHCMEDLIRSGLSETIQSWALVERRPLLGICVGMQLLGTFGEEGGISRGLGWIPGRVTRIVDGPGVRVPHVGWNEVRFGLGATNLSGDFYFDHSFALMPDEDDDVFARAGHGGTICAAVRRGNLVGVQFHPEKSQECGLALLRWFLGGMPQC